jgi:hypothetical protein
MFVGDSGETGRRGRTSPARVWRHGKPRGVRGVTCGVPRGTTHPAMFGTVNNASRSARQWSSSSPPDRIRSLLELTSSFRKDVVKCFSTVFGLMKSRVAISALLSPSAASRAT